ncbi:unnamed protein product [Amoebophrya sp. A25]|nr:unnamed protein product [Amoebophrya sp. A25]|eukprot:GSA25T00005618001.1
MMSLSSSTPLGTVAAQSSSDSRMSREEASSTPSSIMSRGAKAGRSQLGVVYSSFTKPPILTPDQSLYTNFNDSEQQGSCINKAVGFSWKGSDSAIEGSKRTRKTRRRKSQAVAEVYRAFGSSRDTTSKKGVPGGVFEAAASGNDIQDGSRLALARPVYSHFSRPTGKKTKDSAPARSSKRAQTQVEATILLPLPTTTTTLCASDSESTGHEVPAHAFNSSNRGETHYVADTLTSIHVDASPLNANANAWYPSSCVEDVVETFSHERILSSCSKYEVPRSNQEYWRNYELGQQELASMEAFTGDGRGYNMNSNGNALRSWDLHQACDEFIQNFHDQASLMVEPNFRQFIRLIKDKDQQHQLVEAAAGTTCGESDNIGDRRLDARMFLVYEPPNGLRQLLACLSLVSTNHAKARTTSNRTQLSSQSAQKLLYLTNYNTVLPPVCFIGGFTGEEKTKEKNVKQAKGKFGDGLKSGVTVFVRDAANPPVIRTAGHFEYQFEMDVAKYFHHRAQHNQGVKTLHYKVARRKEFDAMSPGGASSTHQEGVSNDLLACCPEGDTLLASVDFFDSATDTQVVLDVSSFDVDLTRYLFLDRNHKEALLPYRPPLCKYEILFPGNRIFSRCWEDYNGAEQYAGEGTETCVFNPRANRKNEVYAGRIYVKGMLAVGVPRDGAVLESSDSGNRLGTRFGNQKFGYNFLDYDVQVRDRHETISERDRKTHISAAWAAHLHMTHHEERRNELCRLLFEALRQNGDCLEAQAIRDSSESLVVAVQHQKAPGGGGQQESTARTSAERAGRKSTDGELVKQYLMQYLSKAHPREIPCMDGQESMKQLIRKAGHEPMVLSPAFFLLLETSGLLPNVPELFEKQKKRKLSEAYSVDRRVKPWPVLHALPEILETGFRTFFPNLRQEHFRLIDVEDLPEETVLFSGLGICSFEMNGFLYVPLSAHARSGGGTTTATSPLNQVYTANENKKVHHQSTWWSEDMNYVLYSDNGRHFIIEKRFFANAQRYRVGVPYVATCENQEWWRPGAVWTERIPTKVSSGEQKTAQQGGSGIAVVNKENSNVCCLPQTGMNSERILGDIMINVHTFLARERLFSPATPKASYLSQAEATAALTRVSLFVSQITQEILRHLSDLRLHLSRQQADTVFMQVMEQVYSTSGVQIAERRNERVPQSTTSSSFAASNISDAEQEQKAPAFPTPFPVCERRTVKSPEIKGPPSLAVLLPEACKAVRKKVAEVTGPGLATQEQKALVGDRIAEDLEKCVLRRASHCPDEAMFALLGDKVLDLFLYLGCARSNASLPLLQEDGEFVDKNEENQHASFGEHARVKITVTEADRLRSLLFSRRNLSGGSGNREAAERIEAEAGRRLLAFQGEMIWLALCRTLGRLEIPDPWGAQDGSSTRIKQQAASAWSSRRPLLAMMSGAICDVSFGEKDPSAPRGSSDEGQSVTSVRTEQTHNRRRAADGREAPRLPKSFSQHVLYF